MKTTQQIIDLIKGWEGWRERAYLCPASVLTIGYGHTGLDVKPGMIISPEYGERLLKKDIERFENGVRKKVEVQINENEFSALVSFAYNVGLGNFNRSTLLRKLNKGDYQGAADQFPRWNKARINGVLKPLRGLTRRREKEREVFLTPTDNEPDVCPTCGQEMPANLKGVL